MCVFLFFFFFILVCSINSRRKSFLRLLRNPEFIALIEALIKNFMLENEDSFEVQLGTLWGLKTSLRENCISSALWKESVKI